MEKSGKANEGKLGRGGSVRIHRDGAGRSEDVDENSLLLRGERKNGAAPHEVHPLIPAHLGTTGNGRRAFDVRLKCMPLVKPFCAARPDTPTVLVAVAEAGWKETGFSRGSDPLKGPTHDPALSFSEAVEVQARGQPTTGQLAGSRCRVPTSLADLRRAVDVTWTIIRYYLIGCSPLPNKAPQDFA